MIKMCICEICGEKYMVEANALACEALGVEKALVKEGDIVERIIKWTDKPYTYEKVKVSAIYSLGHELQYFFRHMDGKPYHINVISNKGLKDNFNF